jgi:hypothetical protein
MANGSCQGRPARKPWQVKISQRRVGKTSYAVLSTTQLWRQQITRDSNRREGQPILDGINGINGIEERKEGWWQNPLR